MTNVAEARKLCPNIRLLHVATLAANDTEPHYYPNPSRNTHKVSLEAYRNASKAIFKIFHSYCDKIQKVGTDEGFLDVTKTVNQRLMDRYINKMPDLLDKLDDEVCGVFVDWEQLGFTIESEAEQEKRLNHEDTEDNNSGLHWEPTTWSDLQLALGAELAKEIRKEIYDKLKYTCSAGKYAIKRCHITVLNVSFFCYKVLHIIK
jgi:DNA polymerase eta